MVIFGFGLRDDLKNRFHLAHGTALSEGYTYHDSSLLSRYYAMQHKAGYLETLHPDMNNREVRINAIFDLEETNTRLVTGDILFASYKQPYDMYEMFVDILHPIAALQRSSGFLLQKVVIPLSYIDFKNPHRSHGMSLCITHNAHEKQTDIVLIEQHARRDGSFLDFSDETSSILNLLH